MTGHPPGKPDNAPVKGITLKGHEAHNFKFEVKDTTAIIMLNRPAERKRIR